MPNDEVAQRSDVRVRAWILWPATSPFRIICLAFTAAVVTVPTALGADLLRSLDHVDERWPYLSPFPSLEAKTRPGAQAAAAAQPKSTR